MISTGDFRIIEERFLIYSYHARYVGRKGVDSTVQLKYFFWILCRRKPQTSISFVCFVHYLKLFMSSLYSWGLTIYVLILASEDAGSLNYNTKVILHLEFWTCLQGLKFESQNFLFDMTLEIIKQEAHINDGKYIFTRNSTICRSTEESYLVYNYHPLYVGGEEIGWTFQEAYLFWLHFLENLFFTEEQSYESHSIFFSLGGSSLFNSKKLLLGALNQFLFLI